MKLPLLCAASRMPISYELTPANVAYISLIEELAAERLWKRLWKRG